MNCMTWHVVLVADCNLRCAYCATDFGRFTEKRTVMDRSLWPTFIDFILEHSEEKSAISFEFGGGETFLAYDDFLALTQQIEDALATIQCQCHFSVTTNGTLLNTDRLKTLADRGVGLEFSLDGPQGVHDSRRPTARGNGSFHQCFSAWKEFKELSRSSDRKPACSIKTVLDPHQVSIDALTEFWKTQGQPIFACTVELPTMQAGPQEIAAWRERQQKYLNNLEQWAFSQARKLDIPHFLSRYEGPIDLYTMWQKLFIGNGGGGAPCTIFKGMLAVDPSGRLYPCEGFVGERNWVIGTLHEGLQQEKLQHYAQLLKKGKQICTSCPANDCCPGSCPAAMPKLGIRTSFEDGCDFALKLTDIAKASYQILLKNSGGQ